MKLLHLERRTQDDEILVTKNVFEVLFRRFIGREPNVSRLSDEELMSLYYARPPKLPPGEKFNRTEGLIVRKVDEPGPGGKSQYHFSALSAVNWLIDFTTVVGEDEGAEVLGQFVRYGYICLVSDKTRNTEGALIVKVRAGGAGGGAGAIMVSAVASTQ
jgi:hypothetical protein